MNPIEKYDAAVKAYLKNLTFIGRSKQTIGNYETRLSLFRTFWLSLHGETPETDPQYDDIEKWRDILLESGKAPSTAAQYLKELSYFFHTMSNPIFGADLQYTLNPVSDAFYPKFKKRPYDLILTDDEVKKLLVNEAPASQMRHTWARNYAIVVLLLCTKIRNSELLDLTLADLDFEYGEIAVEHGKGDKFRMVEFSEFAQSAVKLYLQSGIRPAYLPDTAPLFGTTASHDFGSFSGEEKWHRGTSQWLSSLVERHIKNITGVSDVRTHDLRHVGARLSLNAGASLECIQSELGHSSMNTTQIYTDRLMQRRGRNSAKDVFSAMDAERVRNEAKYILRTPAVAV